MLDVQRPNVDLRECLLALPPVDLLALQLAAQPATTSIVTEAQLVKAVQQLVEYTQNCAIAAEQLATIAPIPLLSMSIDEFGV